MSAPDTEIKDDRTTLAATARLDGLDWLRAGATVLVVALHAGIGYLVARMPGCVWATNDPVGSPAVDGVTWWINGFIMPLFFMQSGFLAFQIMRKKGPRAFLRHRSRRVLGPFLLGCVLILPLDLYAWLLGWAADGKITLHKLRSLKIDRPLGDNLWGVSHLWFLEYLWVFCVVAWMVCRVAEWSGKWQSGEGAKGQGGEGQTGWVVGVASVALMLVSGGALWWEPQIVIGFRHSWWPLPANLLFYGPWFALGWLAHAVRPARSAVVARPVREDDSSGTAFPNSPAARPGPNPPFALFCEWRIVAALGLFAALLPLIHRHVAAESTGAERLALVSLFLLHAWLMVTGLFGVSLRWFNRRPPQAVKYVAEASFWIYLFHHPVVGLAQVSLAPLAVPVVAKFSVTLLIGLTLPLLTYHALVRRTWIGVVLNGRRLGVGTRPAAGDLLPIPVPEPVRLRKSA